MRIDQLAGSDALQMEGMVPAEWWRRCGGAVVDLAVLRLPLWPIIRSVDRPARLVEPSGPAKAAVRYLAPALLSIVTFGLIWFSTASGCSGTGAVRRCTTRLPAARW